MIILELALLLATSLAFALSSRWFGHPYLIGYIATGFVFGPVFMQNLNYSIIVSTLSHFGMIMLIFMIGIEFNLEDFKKLWQKASIIFSIQISLSGLISYIIGYFFHLNIEIILLITFLLVLSSTAVVVKLLEEMKELNNEEGSLILSILILQDLGIIPMMIILKEIKYGFSSDMIFKLFLSLVVLGLLIKYLSQTCRKYFKPLQVLFDGNQEIMTLASLVVCFGFSGLSDLMGLSATYGAFIAGLILGSFGNKEQIIEFSRPVSSLLLMTFFIFIGSQVSMSYIMSNWILVIFLSFFVLIAKFLINYIALYVLGYNNRQNFYVSTMLSQASEFSFTFTSILFSINSISSTNVDLFNTLSIISLTIGSIFPLIAEYFKNLLEIKANLETNK